MNPLQIVVLDRDTLVNRPFDFDFPHTLSSYGTTEAHETLARIRGADIVITNKVVISAQAFAENPQLKLVAVTATGVNNVDVEAAKQNGTAVCNIRAYGNESVAEHAFMMMITLMRNLIVTPHIAWASQEAANRLFDILLDNINRFVAGNPQNLV